MKYPQVGETTRYTDTDRDYCNLVAPSQQPQDIAGQATAERRQMYPLWHASRRQQSDPAAYDGRCFQVRLQGMTLLR